MKAIYTTIFASSVLMTLAGCTGIRLTNTHALVDDVYYDGTQAPIKASTAANTENFTQNDVASYNSRLATYNSQQSSSTVDTRDFSSIQQYYANANSTNGAQATVESGNRTLVVDTVDTDEGYWLGGFDGTAEDQSYAERLIRFHRPFVSTRYYSPLYIRARYSGDWNVYIDSYGDTYMVPTWSNPWYDNYYWGWSYNWGWGSLSWGWRHHWGWSYGWGWHSPYYSPYSYYAWGWHSPYWYSGWGWHHHHHYYSGWGYGSYGYWAHHHYSPRYRMSRAQAAPSSYAPRNRSVTPNPNSTRAAQRYATNRSTTTSGNRSYTRTTDGNPTVNTGNTRRDNSVSTSGRYGAATTGGNRSGQTNMSSGNTRRSDATTSSSHSSYTPSNNGGRQTQRQVNSSSSGRSSSYTPSGNTLRSNSGSSSSRTYSSGGNRSTGISSGSSSGSSRSYSSGSGRSSGSSYSSGRSSGRSSGSSFSSGRSGGSSYSGGRSGGSSSGSGRSSGGRSGGDRGR